MKAGVIVFPGSNCDRDAYYALREVLGYAVEYLWHDEVRDLRDYGLVVVPGGFSYGDYLRPGAIARFARIMDSLQAYVERGGLVLGICNGFQILCEAGLLPGALTRNIGLKFRCMPVHLRVENAETPFTRRYQRGEVLQIPSRTAMDAMCAMRRPCSNCAQTDRCSSATAAPQACWMRHGTRTARLTISQVWRTHSSMCWV
jgi:phosphoribosylformylglycinamidine synthase I